LEDSAINLKTYSANIWVSNDGLSFHELFQLQEPAESAPFEIAGASEIQLGNSTCSPVYFQLSSGANTGAFYRTTDLGKTWKNVNGPGNGIVGSFSVVGRGAVVYALYNLGLHYPYLQLWRTTDGGDGMLTSSVLPETSLEFSSSTDSILQNDDTIFTQLCNSVPLRLSVAFTGCDMIWLDSASIDSIAPNLYYDTLDNRGITSGSQPDTETIVIVPTRAGTFPIRINARLLRGDFVYEDTSISVVLVVRSNPGQLTVSPPSPIDFGTQALCHPVTVKDSIHLSVHGCQQVTVDSMFFALTNGNASDFSFTTVKNFSPDSTSTSFPISFKPSVADSERGNIFIYWSDGASQHIDTISLAGAGVSDTRSFSISCDTLAVRECDSTTGILRFTNTTCGTLVFDSLMLPSGFIFEVPVPTFPFTLLEGMSDSLVVNCSLGSAENSIFSLGDTTVIAKATLLFNDHGTITSFDTTISVPIHVTRGTAAAVLSTPSLDFGSVSVCGGSMMLPIALMSTGCDTLTLAGTNFNLTSPFTSQGWNSSGTSIPVNESDTAFILFAPSQSGSYYDTLRIATNAGVETIPMHGMGTAGSSIFSADSSLRNFGPLYECETSDTTIELINKGCDTLTVSSASFSNSALYHVDTVFPLVIWPQDSVPVRLTFTPQAGNLDDTVHFISNANTGTTTISIPLTGGIIPPATLQLVLGPVTARKQGTTVTCYAVLEGQAPAAMSGLSFDLTHDDDLLGYTSASGMNPGAMTKLGNGIIQQQFTISPLMRTSDTLGTITFQVFLTDSSSTPLDLSNITFTTSKILPLDCIASIAGAGTTFSFQNSCGDSIIRLVMQNQLAFTIQSIIPNPASTSVKVEGNGQRLTAELEDALGKESLPTSSYSLPFTLDVSTLPSGTYYLRMSDGGYIQTRRLEIER
ncbi:MAG TPA: choice-of-anchor D domain-containing protein, partial [Candidatus Kapabacteria bacterium]